MSQTLSETGEEDVGGLSPAADAAATGGVLVVGGCTSSRIQMTHSLKAPPGFNP